MQPSERGHPRKGISAMSSKPLHRHWKFVWQINCGGEKTASFNNLKSVISKQIELSNFDPEDSFLLVSPEVAELNLLRQKGF